MNSDNIKTIKASFVNQHIPAQHLFIEPLPSDASLRSYERISFSDKSVILMDSSKEIDSMLPFIKARDFLARKGLSVPTIIGQDLQNGFLLLEDFGDNTYTKILSNNNSLDIERQLYQKAADVLIKIHKEEVDESFPRYDEYALMKEVLLLVDWYFLILNGTPLPEKLKNEYISIWKDILSRLSYNFDCFVLRDYHIDNMMIVNNREGVSSVGLLDFQDAVLGSYAYDLVSLLEDARRDIQSTIVSDTLHYYLDNLPELDKKKFLTDYAILGVQRSCKIVGIFSRKTIRDKNNKYLIHLPRVWKYIREGLNNPIMEPLKKWFLKMDIPPIRDKNHEN